MEQREGYKKTKVGWIPEHWDELPIKDFTFVVTGNTPPTKDVDNYGHQYPWITPSDIDESKNIETSERKLSEKGFQISRQLPKDTVLITSIASIGKNAILRAVGSCNQQINAILPSEKHNPDYLYYWFEQNTQTLLNLAGQTAVAIINKSTFQKVTPVLPPLSEQKKIASVLTTVDDKISSIEDQIQQTEQLKKGLMEKLLSEGVGHTEFKDTKIGRIPKRWDVVKCDTICIKITDGEHLTPQFITIGVPLVSAKDVEENGVNFNNVKYISEKDNIKMSNRCNPEYGDVLMVSRGATIGRTAYNHSKKKFSLMGSVILLKSQRDKMLSEFLVQYLKGSFIQKYLLKLSGSSAQQAIYLKDIKKLRLCLPSLIEQKQIASILSTVDDKIVVLTKKKSQYQTLRKGLSQQLLTGQMRVKV